MAYPQPFLRLVLNGTLFTNETFSFGLSFNNDFGTGDAPETVPPALVTAASSLFTGSPAVIGDAARLTQLKLNLIGTDGRYVDQGGSVFHDYATPVPGSGTAQFPPQIALAVTLRTAVRRGLASSGRFYLPAPAMGIGPDGLMSAANAVAVRDRVKTWLEAVEDALPGWDLAVFSKEREGAVHPVTAIEVGRVYDTIRSRRASLREQYTAPATHAPD